MACRDYPPAGLPTLTTHISTATLGAATTSCGDHFIPRGFDALPVVWPSAGQGRGLALSGRRLCHPAAPGVPALRTPVHHVRAGRADPAVGGEARRFEGA